MSKQLRKSLLWVGAIVALLIATTVLITGTESGSRWVLAKATDGVSGLEIDEIDGTLLTGLEIGRIGYKTQNFTLTLTQLAIDFSWMQSSTQLVKIRSLSVSELRYQGLGPESSEPKPFDIPIPDVPIALSANDVSVQSIFIDEKIITGAAAIMLGLDKGGLRASSVAASFAEIDIGVRDFAVQFDDNFAMSSDLEWRYQGGEWSGRASLEGSLRTLQFQHELLQPHMATAVGSIKLLQQVEPLVDAVVRFSDLQIGAWTVADSELNIDGTTNDYRVTASASVTNEALFSADVHVEGNGNSAGLDDVEASAQSPRGQVRAVGNISWLPEPTINFRVTGEDIDLADFLPVAPGKLDAELSLVASSPSDFTVDIATVNGTYNDHPIRAHGSFSSVDAAYLCTSCELIVGQNNIAFDGSLEGRSLAATFAVDATALEQLWPELGGSVSANGTLQGSVEVPTLSVNASGELVSWRDWKAGNFTVESRMSEADDIFLRLDIDELSQGDLVFGGGKLLAEGDINAIDVRVDWTSGEFNASARGTVALADDAISGKVSRANVTEPYTGTWILMSPLDFSAGDDGIQVAANNWENGDAELRNDRLMIADGNLLAGATLGNFPLAMVNNVLPENIRLGGRANARISLGRKDNAWTGDLHWGQTDTDVQLLKQGVQEFRVAVPVVKIEVRLDATTASARAEIEVDPGLDGLLEVSIDKMAPDAGLSARLTFSGNEWNWIPAFLPEIDDVQGEIEADISAEGSLKSPQLYGELRWREGKLAIPAFNTPLTDIDVTVIATSADDIEVTGNVTAGSGSLLLDGRLENIATSDRSFSIEVKGNNATLLDWPNYKVTASPDLLISGNTAAVEIVGKLKADLADITVNELPEGAVRPSADVVVAGESVYTGSGFSLTGDVEVSLSERIHIKAFGLDSGLEGNLRVTQVEGNERRAYGELKLIDGLFGAYGQELEIERGTLTFTGPIDDPIINVRAVREIETLSGKITVGVELGGRAKNPSSTLFSSPTMSETDTLSYLVLGRPLQDASASDGNEVADAAFALGVRQAALITHQIGQSLGLDELAIEGSNQSTISLVAGKQINSRLYARYAYGVFARIGNLLLRYQLNDKFTIEVGAGDSQSMDLLYIIETQ